jgi:hypothetical protein
MSNLEMNKEISIALKRKNRSNFVQKEITEQLISKFKIFSQLIDKK